MKKMKGILLLAAVAMFAAGQVYATPINSNTGTEDSMQDILNQIAGDGVLDAANDQAHPSAYWRSGAVGSTAARIKFEFSGNAGINSFGIFDPTNPGNKLQLFSGSDSQGAWASLVQDATDASLYSAVNTTGTTGTADFAADNLFGFYLETPNGTFYSDPSLNTDSAEHLVAYQGGSLLGNEYIFGWEDSILGSQAGDYNDFVVTVESIDPVPEPSALAMFGLGLLGLGLGLRMTRRSRS